MGVEDRFDFLRSDVLATSANDVAEPVDEVDGPVVVDQAEVSGPESAVRERGGRGGGIVNVLS
jgi:hypothetical protein